MWLAGYSYYKDKGNTISLLLALALWMSHWIAEEVHDIDVSQG